MKKTNLNLMRAALLALLASASLLASAPGRAESAPAAQAPTSPAPVTTETRVAWDRVGSPERTFA